MNNLPKMICRKTVVRCLSRPVYIFLLMFVALASCETHHGNNSKYEVSVGSKEERNIDNGHRVFQANCASCHTRMKDATGPALNRSLIANRSDEWIITLLTDQKHLVKDSLYRRRVKEYGMSCYEARISKDEVLDVLAYIRNPGGCY